MATSLLNASLSAKLATACLEALSALALNQPSCAHWMLSAAPSSGTLSQRIESILEQAAGRGVARSSADEGRAVLAAHVLIYVLGVGVFSQRQGQGQGQGQDLLLQPQLTASGVEAVSSPLGDGLASCTGQRLDSGSALPPCSLYLSLTAAAGLVSIRLPGNPTHCRGTGRPHDASDQKVQWGRCVGEGPTGRPHEASAAACTAAVAASPSDTVVNNGPMMLFEELAELQHTIHDVLLPRMREPNATAASSAVAQLYQLVAGPTGSIISGTSGRSFFLGTGGQHRLHHPMHHASRTMRFMGNRL